LSSSVLGKPGGSFPVIFSWWTEMRILLSPSTISKLLSLLKNTPVRGSIPHHERKFNMLPKRKSVRPEVSKGGKDFCKRLYYLPFGNYLKTRLHRHPGASRGPEPLERPGFPTEAFGNDDKVLRKTLIVLCDPSVMAVRRNDEQRCLWYFEIVS
jgi:hypothetical protein